MEISYKRDLARSFMCIVSDEEWDPFEEECLQKGRIEGFLPIRVTRENGRTVCWYDITGRQALDRMFEVGKMEYTQLVQLLGGLCDVMLRAESYLLRPENILLKPECIFGEYAKEGFAFCYSVHEDADMQEEFAHLMEYLITQVDHKDERAVRIAYRIFEEVKNPPYSLFEIRESLTAQAGCMEERAEEEVFISVQERHPAVEMKEEQSIAPAQTKTAVHSKTEKKLKQTLKDRLQRALRQFARRTFPDYFRLQERKKDRNREKENQTIVFEPEEEEIKRGRPTVLLSERVEQIRGILKYEGEHHLPDLKLDTFPYIVGSAAECNGCVESDTVSRIHARFTKVEDIYFVEDLNSANGTKIGGRELDYKGKASLQKNEIIEFADEKFRFI